MRVCSRCGSNGPFYGGTKSAKCKECHKKQWAAYYANNKVKIAARGRVYRKNNKLKRLRSNQRNRGLDISTIPESKADKCEICGRSGRIVCDHDHATGKFRGWLCDRCNRSIGLLQDSPSLLGTAKEYLERVR